MNKEEALTAAAMSITDPDLSTSDYIHEVRNRAIDLIMLGRERIFEVIERAMSNDEADKDFKMFTGIVDDVTLEQRSQRALVTLETQKSNWHPDGKEKARTERIDSSESARSLANALHAAIGHRVLVFIEVKEKNDGTGKVRIIQHFVDLEPDMDADDT